MIWSIFLVFLGLASARNVKNVDPEYLEALRSSGQDEEFAKLLGVDVSLVKADDNVERSEAGFFGKPVSPLGDILLLEESEQERQGINFAKYGGSRWPNGRIPYVVRERDFNSDQLNIIYNAIADFNRDVTNVQLVPRRRQSDYVLVFSGSGCWSYLGRIGGQQGLSLQENGCVSKGTVQHEFLHAVGFTHEHNRADRDNHVTVLWDNIPENWRSQYQKVDEEDFSNIHNYDHYSVMHYPIWAPETFRDAFRLPDGVDRNRVGAGNGMTNTDIRKTNTLYS